MSADVAARLRLLSHDYHDGRIDLAAYRALRAPLLDSLVLDGVVARALEVTQPRAAWQVQPESITRPGKPRVPASARADVPASKESPPKRGAARMIGVIALGVAVIVVLAVAIWGWRSHETSAENASNGNASGTTVDAAEQARVRDLISPLIDRGEWNDAQLASLDAALLELGANRMAAVAREPWYQRFVDELRRRLKEQQALATTTLTADNSPLAALAVTAGLDLKSPDAAIHIAALEPARPPEDATQVHASSPTAGTRHVGAAPGGAGPPAADASAGFRTPPKAGAVASVATSAMAGAKADAGTSVSASTNVGVKENANAPSSTTVNHDESACRIELARSRRPLCHDTLPAGAEGPLMALISAGSFEMGSTAAAEEQPVHRVTIREPFAMSVYEVSQGEFKQFCEQSRRQCASQPWSGDDYPVVNVSWDDARAYTDWLSSVTHHRYSLPTEAQWEYAARAGRTGLFPGGDALSPTDAHYSMLTQQTVAARRGQRFNANPFRLVHTVGNVREWVEDAWTPTFAGASDDGAATTSPQVSMRVARGGSYRDGASRLRLSMREGLAPGTRDVITGFRIVRELP
ncbi:MAG: SUMF1/EgtB/PvdO family nonheme iron enzyme [Gammaproteobacteria bacterium]